MGVYDRSKDFDGDSNNTDSRFGFIVSTKISKKAVVRNKIKRIIAESIRKRLPNIKKGQDIVFLIKPNVIKITKKELENEVHEIITKNIQVHNLPHP
jgi:ribonuclease P protein component